MARKSAPPPPDPQREFLQSLLPTILTLLVGVLLDRVVPGGLFGVVVPLGLAFAVTAFAYWPRLRTWSVNAAWLVASFAILGMGALAVVQYYRGELMLRTAPPDALLQSYIRGVGFRLTDLYREQPAILREKTFEDCHIYGPGMLLLTGQTNLIDNNFDVPLEAAQGRPFTSQSGMEAMLVEVVGGQTIFGGITCKDCTFRRCGFHQVQFLVPAGEKAGLIARATNVGVGP